MPSTTADPTGGRADIAALESLIEESRQLRDDMRADRAQQQFRFRWTQVFIGALVLAVAGLAFLAVQNQRIASSNREISAQIADCTTEGGACWDESRARSKTNVTAILNTTIYVAECLRQVDRALPQPRYDADLEGCIRQQLFADRQPIPAPTPTPRIVSPTPAVGVSR
jgi:hypothetical protein